MSNVSSHQKKHILKIWARARANAFAHRSAASNLSGLANVMFTAQFVLGLFSFFLVVVLYAIISRDGWISSGLTPLFLTLWSLFYSMLAMGVSVMQNYIRFEERSADHNHNHHSFLYLAQRSREIDSPGMDMGRAQALIDDLERDFQILKVRGREPADRDFRVGHSYLHGIAESQFSQLQTASLRTIDGSPEAENPTSAKKHCDEKEGTLVQIVRDNEVSNFERHTAKFVGALVAFGLTSLIFSTYLTCSWAYADDQKAYSSRSSVTPKVLSTRSRND